MAKRMLIDATHAEETRVVVLDGNRLDEFDFETSTKKQVKGNIYLAKITRVEPSLQAAFVDFGGNRHGFLAFSEIHPDYYRIPIGDRAPGRDERGGHRDRRDEQGHGEHRYRRPADAERGRSPADEDRGREDRQAENGHGEHSQSEDGHGEDNHHHDSHGDDSHAEDNHGENPVAEFLPLAGDSGPEITARPIPDEAGLPSAISGETPPPPPFAAAEQPGLDRPPSAETRIEEAGDRDYAAAERSMAVEVSTLPPEMEGGDHAAPASEPVAAPAGEPASETPAVAETVETVGGDEFEEAARQRSRSLRHYKIQEVVKRRQIMLVQVTKEERGNKGAALTTYLSLAGRYCVLMPNTGRGGGVSRKITSATDRRRLKELLDELELPEGMGVIVRTAGSERSKAEIKRDLEYLLRLWDEIRSLTLQSTAPALIYEEGNLIKRSIRDLYARDIDEVLVEGEEGYKTAKAFMKMLMPSHAKRVQPYRDPAIPLLHRFQVESQIDLIHSPVVQLRSGGYIVINPTEALVAIDVNSGRSTKERNIEETALRTNLEAAEEIARQLRLRDLAGLIVIDFIDMEEHRNQGAVERRLKEGMKYDRARIQLGRISPFGLLELSRQRLRPSLVEASTQPCPHCGGTGHIRSTESTALHVLRAIEEEGIRRRSAEICIYVPTAVALYVLNQKRQTLAQIEQRYGFRVTVAHDDALIPPAFRLERLRNLTPEEAAMIPAATMQLPPPIEEDDDEEVEETEAATVSAAPEQGEELSEEQRGKRRRRRRRRRPDDEPQAERWSEPHDGSHDPQAKAPERAEDDGGDDGGPDAPMPTHHRDLSAGEGEAGHAPGEQLGENSVPGSELAGEGEHPGGRKRRRRGKRGGRRRGRGDAPSRSPGDDGAGWRANDASHEAAAEQVEVVHEPESLGEMERQGIEPAFAVSQFRAADETLDMAEAPVMDAGETLRSHHPPQAPRVEHRILNDAEERDAMPPLAERPQAPMREPSAPAAEAATPPAAADPGPTVPSPKIVTEKPANPKRGWWQRLIDS